MADIIKNIKKGDVESPIYAKRVELFSSGSSDWSGVKEGIELTEPCYQYDLLEIHYRTDDSERGVLNVYAPRAVDVEGKSVLSTTKIPNNQGYLVVFSAIMKVKNTTITLEDNGRAFLNFESGTWSKSTSVGINIYRIFGYKY